MDAIWWGTLVEVDPRIVLGFGIAAFVVGAVWGACRNLTVQGREREARLRPGAVVVSRDGRWGRVERRVTKDVVEVRSGTGSSAWAVPVNRVLWVGSEDEWERLRRTDAKWRVWWDLEGRRQEAVREG